MARIAAALFLFFFTFSISLWGQEPPPTGRILLVPIDDRPATAQFAVMIGAIADHQVSMPPTELLGRFTTAGNTEKIEAWLRRQDYSQVDALIVSVDMLTYGGLIASRAAKVSEEKARERLEFFRWFHKTYPSVPLYAFSVILRVAPTADAASRPWREDLARWAELKDRAPKTADPQLQAELSGLEKKLSPTRLNEYLTIRKRNLKINYEMAELAKEGLFNALVFLQDDAREFGLHRQDQEVLRRKLREDNLEKSVPIYNGADEGSLSLVSRALLEKFRRPIVVEAVYSSAQSRQAIAPFEDHPLQYTVENQIRSAGGRPAAEGQRADYRLYINAPQTTEAEFESFHVRLVADLRAGRPTALADLLFPAPHYSGADERLIRILEREGLCDRLTGYAAWNTAGNTLGTAIPQANLRALWLSLPPKKAEQAARAQAAQLEFLLHRFAGDYLYHDVVRWNINRKMREEAVDRTDEFDPETYTRINRLTEEQLCPLLENFFTRHFQGKRYPLDFARKTRFLNIDSLRDVKIRLPWPRTFEVTIEYRFTYRLTEGS